MNTLAAIATRRAEAIAVGAVDGVRIEIAAAGEGE